MDEQLPKPTITKNVATDRSSVGHHKPLKYQITLSGLGPTSVRIVDTIFSTKRTMPYGFISRGGETVRGFTAPGEPHEIFFAPAKKPASAADRKFRLEIEQTLRVMHRILPLPKFQASYNEIYEQAKLGLLGEGDNLKEAIENVTKAKEDFLNEWGIQNGIRRLSGRCVGLA